MNRGNQEILTYYCTENQINQIMIKSISTLLFVCILASINSFAQSPTLYAINFPTIGETWSNTQIADTSIQPGGGGMNTTWNFSNYFPNPSVISETYEAPTNSGNDTLFPNANLKASSYFGGYDYYVKTANDLQYLGSKSNTIEILITNVQQILTVPFTYGSSITNQPVTGTGIGGWALSGNVTVTGDGYGDLILFTQTFTNALRVKTDINLVQGAGTGLDTYIHIEKYAWYSSLYRAPVFQISVVYVSGALATFQQKITTISTLTTDVQNLSSSSFDFQLTPNPVRSQAEINLFSKTPITSEFRISDLTGKIWKSERHDLHSGMQHIAIDVSSLPAGIYMLTAGEGTYAPRRRFVKN